MKQRLQLRQLIRLLIRARERHVDVVVQNDHQPDLAGEIQDAIERRIGQARGSAGHLRRDELLVDGEFADAGNTPGNVVSTRRM